MSGDVQPRKRKDKKKRKDDGDQIPEKPHVSSNTLNNEDVNIHVHKEEGTGGGICAKFVFFILFSALAVLIGLIIIEYRGLTDLETIDSDSKFSQIFEGWVDSNNHDDHNDHDVGAIEDLDEDHEGIDDDDHHENHSEEDDLDNDDDKLDETELSEELEDDDDEDDDEELEPIKDDDDDLDDEHEEDDLIDDVDEIDDEDEDENNDEETKETEDFVASEEDDDEDDENNLVDEQKDDDDEEEPQDDEDNTDELKDIVDDEEDDGDNQQEVDDQDIDDQNEKDEEPDNTEDSIEKRDISGETLDEEENIDNNKEDNKDNKEYTDDEDQEDKQDEDVTADRVSNEKDAEEDTISDRVEILKKDEVQPELKAKEIVEQVAEKSEDDNLASSSMAVKLGVGLALLVVAHLVLVKKWRNADDDTLPSAEKPPPPVVQDRRNTIIVPPAFKEVESEMEQVQEDFYDDDEEEEDEIEEEDENEEEEEAETISEPNSAKVKYQELATAYTRPITQPNIDEVHGDYEYEEVEEEEEESEEEDGEGEEYDDEEVEDDDEDEELLKRLEARYGKLQKDNGGKLTENKDSDSDKQSESNDYEYANITNEDDYRIRQEIDEAQSSIKNNTSHAIALFDKILQKFPSSPRTLYGKAMALDLLADQRRSNDLLEKSLQIYEQVLQTEKTPSILFQLVAERCINRMRFIGHYKKAIAVHKLIISRFPNNPKHLNSLVVTYLTINRIEDARTVLKQILTKWPEDGFALVHYGFILKTSDNELEEAVRYLKKGIQTKDVGVIDGRFYFHLGDALVRLGRRDEAAQVYEEGKMNKVFLSKYQRSLYNVPHLTGKPWWDFKDLPSYSKSLSLLLESWKQIRNEGLSVLNENGYFQDESENLRHTGEWKQFELYARGKRNVKNCKICPITCSIINKIPEARTCKRGQTKFSVMHPGTHIWPHCGPTNCRLRIHLGLKVPTNTLIRVADDVKNWKEGELLIFDDSFEHEVWHNGTGFRLVLIVDIWHPELTPTEKNNLSPI